jgi:hypothetical protein
VVNKARKGSENHSTQVSLSWSSINFFTEAVVLLAKNKMKDKFSKPSWTVSDSSFMKVPSIYKKNLLSLTTTRENSRSEIISACLSTQEARKPGRGINGIKGLKFSWLDVGNF